MHPLPKSESFHKNPAPGGPAHYYRSRSGTRLLFRAEEIVDIDPTPAGAIITVKGGLEYKVTCPRPEQIIP